MTRQRRRSESQGRKASRHRSTEQGDHQGLSLGRHHRRARPRQARRQLSRGPQEPGGRSSQLSPARPSAADAATRRNLVGVGGRLIGREPQVLDNLPEMEEELTPDDVRPEATWSTPSVLESGALGESSHRQPRAQGEERDHQDRRRASRRHDGRRNDGRRHDGRSGMMGGGMTRPA